LAKEEEMQYREPELGDMNTELKNIIDTNGKAGKGSKAYYVSAKDEQIGNREPELGDMNTGSENMNTGSENMNTRSRSENMNTGLENITSTGYSSTAGVAFITTLLSFLLLLH
jgi:hypothetical protein